VARKAKRKAKPAPCSPRDHLFRLVSAAEEDRLLRWLRQRGAAQEAALEILRSERARRDLKELEAWTNVLGRQMLTVQYKRLPTRARWAQRGLAALIAFHENLSALDDCMQAYEAALTALRRDPLLAPSNSGRNRASIAGEKRKGGRPPTKLPLGPTRRKLAALGIRRKDQDEGLAAVHLLPE
jgi:hypothetical protein